MDNIRGILFLIICVAHVLHPIANDSFLFSITSTLTGVAVGGFYLFSGYLINQDSIMHMEFRTFLMEKIKSLFIPYLLLSLFTSLFSPYFLNTDALLSIGYPKYNLVPFDFPEGIKAGIEWFIGDVICIALGLGSRQAQPLWFVFDLFIAQILYFILRRILKLNDWLIVFACFIVASLCDIVHFHLPYVRLAAILMAVSLLGAGAIMKRSAKPTLIKSLIAGLVCFVCFYITSFCGLFVIDNVGGYYAGIVYLKIVSVIYFSVYIFKSLSSIVGRPTFLTYLLYVISAYSIYILALHFYFIVFF